MGKGQKAGKKPKPEKVVPAMSEHTFNKLVREIRAEATEQMMILATAYVADEYGLTDEGVCDLWTSMARWTDALDENVIKINKVCEIVKNMTGLEIHWWGRGNDNKRSIRRY